MRRLSILLILLILLCGCAKKEPQIAAVDSIRNVGRWYTMPTAR